MKHLVTPKTSVVTEIETVTGQGASDATASFEVARQRLEAALSDTGANRRVESLKRDDQRSLDEVDARWSSLERVIDAFVEHVGEVDDESQPTLPTDEASGESDATASAIEPQ